MVRLTEKQKRDARFFYEQIQHGQCAICKRETKRLVLDHCHETGQIRGLLCDRCNMTLEWAHEQKKAIALYLRQNGRLVERSFR